MYDENYSMDYLYVHYKLFFHYNNSGYLSDGQTIIAARSGSE